ncbi:methyltransferase [Spirillospora sp. CA-128828]|uniref:RraA family protein n=1 Tax=Spirillospora sp. CA-128828 TaxID=3240033 RepID=UPI003D8B2A89
MSMPPFDRDHIRTVPDLPRAPADRIAGFAGVPVAVIGDAMERLGMCDAGIGSITPGRTAVGSVLPVLVRSGDNAGVHACLEYVRPGDVVVVSGQADMSRALVGALLARKFAAAGAAGVVIDGCVRDQAELRELGFPVWARGVTPAGPYKHGPAVIGEPVAVGGVVAAAGDLVAADDDGVIVVPAARAAEVRAGVDLVLEKEAAMLAAIKGQSSDH